MTEAEARQALAEFYDPRGVDIWLNSRHRWMDMQRPIDLIRSGDTAPVERAIAILVGGAFT